MIDELQELPDLSGTSGSLWDTIDLVVPHQANKTMVIDLASKSGLSADRLYFNIEQVGNTSAASIPAAIADAVRDNVITATDAASSPPASVPAPSAGFASCASIHASWPPNISPRPSRQQPPQPPHRPTKPHPRMFR